MEETQLQGNGPEECNPEDQVNTLTSEIEELKANLKEKELMLKNAKILCVLVDNIALVHENDIENLRKMYPDVINTNIHVSVYAPVIVTLGGYKFQEAISWETTEDYDDTYIYTSYDIGSIKDKYVEYLYLKLFNDFGYTVDVDRAENPGPSDNIDYDRHYSSATYDTTVELKYVIVYHKNYLDTCCKKYSKIKEKIFNGSRFREWITMSS